MVMALVIILVVIVALIAWAVGIFNSLVGLRNQVKNAWAQIEVQLKRRHDLIPNLVETVKGYMTHESETLENVTKARTMAAGVSGTGPSQQIPAENVLTQALGKLFAVAEAYPNLKANENFMALQEELTSTENKISFARQFYNDTVMRFNNKIQMFPSNIFAGMFNFQASTFFETEDAAEREAPQVKF